MNIEHNATIWEITLDGFKNFKNNTIGSFKAPASMVRRFNNFETIEDKTKAFLSIANTYIDGIRSIPKGRKLNSIPWSYLQSDTRLKIQEGVYGAIQHAVLNNKIYERVNSGKISTNTFQISTDISRWFLRSDLFGMFAQNSLSLSGIDEYEWIEDEELTYNRDNYGNIEIVRSL